MIGVIPIDKPQGFTSFDVVAKLRGILKTRRLGHSGTLDPMATGVLPVFIGRATRAIDLLPDGEKRYIADFKLGISTDTGDITGDIIKKTDVKLSKDDLTEILGEFTGKISQIPPMYSAVRVNGKRLYELAREGKTVERKPREVEIFDIKIAEFDPQNQCGRLHVSCSKGTYIRTLICDISERAGCLGTMTALRRTYSQGFDISACRGLDEVQSAADNNKLDELIIPVERCFEDYPGIMLDTKSERLYKNGASVKYPENGLYRVFGSGFLGIGKAENGVLRAVKNFFGDD